jgi:biopolymer transport protein ExbB
MKKPTSMRASLPNLIVVLCGGAILLSSSLTHGQPLAQGIPSLDVAAPFASPAGAAATPTMDKKAVAPGTVGREEAIMPSSSPTEAAAAELRRDLTPLGMFMSADIIVKGVMLGLVFASALTWTIWLAKTFELVAARHRLKRAQDGLSAAHSLAQVSNDAGTASSHVARLIQAVEGELRRSPDPGDVDGVRERITARFERIEASVGRRMMRATGILATIGATAPFVGLFGTVWGIMNSFIGISRLHTTNLAVVAPGIAEALLATAFGLAAAIPAVVIYNSFARAIADYRALFADASVEILTLVGRDLGYRQGADDGRVHAAVQGGAR